MSLINRSSSCVDDRRSLGSSFERRFRTDRPSMTQSVHGGNESTLSSSTSSRTPNFATFPRSLVGRAPSTSKMSAMSSQSQTGQVSPTCRPLSVQRISESVTNLHINEAQKDILEETTRKHSTGGGRINRCRSVSHVSQQNLGSSQESISASASQVSKRKRRVKREMCRTVEVTRTIISEKRLYKTMSEPVLNTDLVTPSPTKAGTLSTSVSISKPSQERGPSRPKPTEDKSHAGGSVSQSNINNREIPSAAPIPTTNIDKVAPPTQDILTSPKQHNDGGSVDPQTTVSSKEEEMNSAPIKLTALEMTDLSESIRQFIRDKHLQGPLYHLVISKDESGKFGFSVGQQDCGLCVTRVLRGSPAHKAGMKEGDFLIKINGMPLIKSSNDTIHKILSKHDDVSVVIIRPAQKPPLSSIKPLLVSDAGGRGSETSKSPKSMSNSSLVSSSNAENTTNNKLAPPAKPPKLSISSPVPSPKKGISNIIGSFKSGAKKKTSSEHHSEEATAGKTDFDSINLKWDGQQEVEDDSTLNELNIHAYNHLRNIYSSIERMTQLPSATAFYLIHTLHNDSRLIPTLFRILLEIQTRVSQQPTYRAKDRVHHLYQIYSTFVHKKSPLPLPPSYLEEYSKFVEQFEADSFESAFSKSGCSIETELKEFVQQIMQEEKLWNAMPECLRGVGGHNREEELQIWDHLMKDHFDNLRKEAKTKKAASAKYWCLFRIGSFYIDANLLCLLGENADTISWTPSTDDDTKSINSGNYANETGASNATSSASSHYSWLNPKALPWRAKKGHFRLSRTVKADIKNHYFLAFALDRPMDCEICEGLLWGPESLTLRCQYCGICIHHNCSTDNLVKCNRRRSVKDRKPSDLIPSSGNALSPPNINEELVSPTEDHQVFSSLSPLSSYGGSSENIRQSINGSPKPLSDSKHDLSVYFPEKDPYFQVPESYDARETLNIFPDCGELNDAASKRLHALAEFEYYIRYTIKQLKIVQVFSHQLWRELVSSTLDPLWKCFSFNSAAELATLYPALHQLIRANANNKTYETFGDSVLQWLTENQVQLFPLINRYCTSVRNPLIWNEVEKLQPHHDGLNVLFNQYQCQRFKMRVKLESIQLVLTVRIDLLLKNIVQKLKKNKFTEEAEIWAKISQWYNRIPVYQNSRIQPLLGIISGSNLNDGDLLFSPTFEYFPKQLCPEFLFEYHPVQLNSITAAGGNMNFCFKYNRPGLILLFERHLVILQQDDGQHYRLKPYKPRKTELTSSRAITPMTIIPIFPTKCLVSRVTGRVMNLISDASVVHRMELTFQSEEEALRLHESVQLHTKSHQDTSLIWKRFFLGLDKECVACVSAPQPVISTNNPMVISLTGNSTIATGESMVQSGLATSSQPAPRMDSPPTYSFSPQRRSPFETFAQQFLQGDVTFARMQLYFALAYARRANSDLSKSLQQISTLPSKITDESDVSQNDWQNLLTQILHNCVEVMANLEDMTCRTFASEANTLKESDDNSNEVSLKSLSQNLTCMNDLINSFRQKIDSEIDREGQLFIVQQSTGEYLSVDDDHASIPSSASTQYFDALDTNSVSGETVKDEDMSCDECPKQEWSQLNGGKTEENLSINDDLSNSSTATPTPRRRSSLSLNAENEKETMQHLSEKLTLALESQCALHGEDSEPDQFIVDSAEWSTTEDSTSELEKVATELLDEIFRNLLNSP